MNILVIGEGWIKTGFGTVVTHLVQELARKRRSGVDNLALFGINWRDMPDGPQRHCSAVYHGSVPQKDWLGYDAIAECALDFKPDAVIMVNDPTPCAIWSNRIRNAGFHDAALVAYIPVDGEIVDTRPYEELARTGTHIVSFTLYGSHEVLKTNTHSSVDWCYPGTDTEQFNLTAREGARDWWNRDQGRELLKPNDFVICTTNRNAPRKMLHVALMAIENFARNKPNVKVFIRAGRDDYGGDFYPILNRLRCGTIVLDPEAAGGRGVNTMEMARLYGASNVFVSASVTEGWGLCETEAACCGCDLVLPDNTVRRELWNQRPDTNVAGPILVPCKTRFYSPRYCNTIGGLVDPRDLADGIERAYKREPLSSGSYHIANFRARHHTYSTLADTILSHATQQRRSDDAA